MSIGSMQISLAQPTNTISATKKHRLGMLYIDELGRKWRYCKAGASALAAGKLTASTEAAANHVNVSVAAAAAIGAYNVSVTVGATAVTADQYADGYLHVNDGTGEGYSYPIVSNTACDSSGTTVVKLAEPVKVALVASATSEVSLIASPYYATVIAATPECLCVGIPPCAVTASYYYWSQTGGLAIGLTSATGAVGTQLIVSGTDGAFDVVATQSDIDVPKIGYAYATVGVATEYKPIFLQID